jgi:hypothetical protein
MKSMKILSRWVAKNEPAVPGKVRTVRLRCGKDTCKCQSGKDADKHGPYYFWDRKVDGKLTSTSVPKADLPRFYKWIENREKLEEIVTQIKKESESLAKNSICKEVDRS